MINYDRAILHSDLNSFYASVEMVLNPSLRGKAVAVCGSTEDRHGIVLAKSELAKKAGVKTGMVNWEAKKMCPGLIILSPKFENYLKYSKATRDIYLRYTDQVEPYGLDECWLDVTGSRTLFGDGLSIAERIRKEVKDELGITVSIGVSYNKVFAKLGSDMKKPDATTQISRENYKKKVWPLPACELLYVGRSTQAKLARCGIYTIGDIAKAPLQLLEGRLGKNGRMLSIFANGEEQSRVMKTDFVSPIKSVGHGVTCREDLLNNEEAWRIMLHLSQDIGHRLRKHEMSAQGVQISVKNENLSCRQYQSPLLIPTQSPMVIALKARELFEYNFFWNANVRALTVCAINLVPNKAPRQLMWFDDEKKYEKREKIDDTTERIRERFGKKAILPASLLGDIKLPNGSKGEGFCLIPD